MNVKPSIIGGAIAFLLATSCCWLPALLVAIGSASSLLAFANGLEQFSAVFMAIGALCLLYGAYQFYFKSTAVMTNKAIQLQSMLTCPECGHQKEEAMPTDACQFFYECSNCKKLLKPNAGDCCVYCSFGTVVCPPMQVGGGCC
jgi:hypothetical protein